VLRIISRVDLFSTLGREELLQAGGDELGIVIFADLVGKALGPAVGIGSAVDLKDLVADGIAEDAGMVAVALDHIGNIAHAPFIEEQAVIVDALVLVDTVDSVVSEDSVVTFSSQEVNARQAIAPTKIKEMIFFITFYLS
jgi:hypothetical protein